MVVMCEQEARRLEEEEQRREQEARQLLQDQHNRFTNIKVSILQSYSTTSCYYFHNW